jgi:hypothetical protein
LALRDLSEAALREGRAAEARARCAASLRLMGECKAIVDIPTALDQMGRVAAAEGDWLRAARLLGAAAGLRDGLGVAMAPYAAGQREGAVSAAACKLGPEAFSAAHAEGASMSLDDAVALAVGELG